MLLALRAPRSGASGTSPASVPCRTIYLKKMENMDELTLSERRDLPREEVIALYEANNWSSAKKPDQLYAALRDSHTLISAWVDMETRWDRQRNFGRAPCGLLSASRCPS